jgi:hypothetical protein
MCELFGDSTRWDEVKKSLLDADDGVLSRLEPRAEVGVAIYDGTVDVVLSLGATGNTPGPACAASFTASSMTGDCPRLIEVPPGPGSVAEIEAAYPTALSGGSTPTDKALGAVLERIIQNGAGPEPDRTHAVVLITDGLPNDICLGGTGGDGSAQRSAVIASVDRAASFAVTTYVVNLAGTDAALDLFTTEVAQHGAPADPSASAYEPVDPGSLRAALEEIAADVLDCPL